MFLWLFRRLLWQKKILTDPATLFSILGIALGVAFLVVSMAGFSGFMRSLKGSIIDVSGDISVFKRGTRIANSEKVINDIYEASPEVTEVMGYVKKEGLVAHSGKLSAVLLQGVDWESKKNQADLNKRVVKKRDQSQETPVGAPALLGKVVAQNLNLDVGDSFKVIVPKVSKAKATEVEPRVQTFFVEAILNFGKYEFNERVVVTEIHEIQKLAEMGEQINGFRVKVQDSEQASEIADIIQDKLGWDYSVRDWSMTNRSLFKAIQYEKRVLFFVMLIMLVAAFFNVATTLFLSVLRRYAQISVLRALGLKRRHVIFLFCFHGLSLGFLGMVLGLVMGVLFCFGFDWLQVIYPIMPEEVYKMSNFGTHIKVTDLFWVGLATLFICFLSTLAPAIHGSRLSPVEGLKYE